MPIKGNTAHNAQPQKAVHFDMEQYTMEAESPIPSVSDITLARNAQTVVSNAISGASE